MCLGDFFVEAHQTWRGVGVGMNVWYDWRSCLEAFGFGAATKNHNVPKKSHMPMGSLYIFR